MIVKTKFYLPADLNGWLKTDNRVFALAGGVGEAKVLVNMSSLYLPGTTQYQVIHFNISVLITGTFFPIGRIYPQIHSTGKNIRTAQWYLQGHFPMGGDVYLRPSKDISGGNGTLLISAGYDPSTA